MVHEMSHFYNELFNQWYGDLVIRFLDLHASYEQVRISKDDTQVFERILAFLHNFARLGATASHISERFTFLEQRYTTWKAIIGYEGVKYDQAKNEVEAEDSVWDAICEEFKLGRIYRSDGNEHMWEELNGIFGPDSVRSERNAQITPYNGPATKRHKEDEEYPDYADGSRAVDCGSRSLMRRDGAEDETEPDASFPKGQYCPYSGDWIHVKKEAPSGSSTKTSKKGREIKSKRNLNF